MVADTCDCVFCRCRSRFFESLLWRLFATIFNVLAVWYGVKFLIIWRILWSMLQFRLLAVLNYAGGSSFVPWWKPSAVLLFCSQVAYWEQFSARNWRSWKPFLVCKLSACFLSDHNLESIEQMSVWWISFFSWREESAVLFRVVKLHIASFQRGEWKSWHLFLVCKLSNLFFKRLL